METPTQSGAPPSDAPLAAPVAAGGRRRWNSLRGRLLFSLILMAAAMGVLAGRSLVWERVRLARGQAEASRATAQAAADLARAYAAYAARPLPHPGRQRPDAHEPSPTAAEPLYRVTGRVLERYPGVEGGLRSAVDGEYYGYAFPTSPPPAPAYGPPPREVGVLDSLTAEAAEAGEARTRWAAEAGRFAATAHPVHPVPAPRGRRARPGRLVLPRHAPPGPERPPGGPPTPAPPVPPRSPAADGPVLGVAWALQRRDDLPTPGPVDGWVLLAFGLTLSGALLLVGSVVAFRRQTALLRTEIAATERALVERAPTPPLDAPRDAELAGIARSVRALSASLVQSRAAEDALAADLARSEHLAALGRLAAGVAHEVRTPLAGIKTRLQLWLRRAPEAVRNDPALPEVIAQIDRLGRLVDQLYGLAQAGELPLSRGPVAASVAQGTEAARSFAEAAGARLTLELAGADVPGTDVPGMDVPDVPHNPLAVERVVVNLVRNAVEAGAEHVAVRLRAAPAGVVPVGVVPAGVVLEVEDDGPGPGTGGTDRWFEPFHSGRPGGLGLGLAICSEVARRHGGRITAAEAPALGGTLVTLTLPDAPDG